MLIVIVMLTPGAKAPLDHGWCFSIAEGLHGPIPRTSAADFRKQPHNGKGAPPKKQRDVSRLATEIRGICGAEQGYGCVTALFSASLLRTQVHNGLGPLHPEDDFPAKLGCSPRLTSLGQPSNHQPHPEAAVLLRSLVALKEGHTRKRLAQ